jgi:uncharacterized protein YkwD
MTGIGRIASLLLLAALMVLPGLLHAPTAHAAIKVAPDPYTADLEQYMFDLINSSRADAGLAPYTWNDTLADVARAHSQLNLAYDPEKGCPNVHQCPGEDPICTRFTNAGVTYTECRENVGNRYAYPTLDHKDGLLKIHQFFMSEGPCGGCGNHYENIMSSTLQEVGVGVAFDDNHIWVTEDFIQP